MVASITPLEIRWEPLPHDCVLPDDPVDNIAQPALAAALTDALTTAARLPSHALVTTNYGICATVNDKLVVKAPDWAYIPKITVDRSAVLRSYTPQLQGDLPLIVMEFLSDTDGHEYSIKPTYPPGKWFFYERIIQASYYVLFDLETASLEVYALGENQRYALTVPDQAGRYWIPEMGLSLGLWTGQRENRDGWWLRWWDADGNLLLWASERLATAQQRGAKLAAQLRELGVDPDTL